MEANRLQEIIKEYRPKEKRWFGRPRKRWGDQNVEPQQA
jgi:hypothetical protein